MDGTIVDTEPYWIAAEAPLVAQFGGSWTHEQSLRLVGLGLEEAARILQQAGVRMTTAAIIDLLTDRVLEALTRDGAPFLPGARELLGELKAAGIRVGLVTMSMRRMALHIANLIGPDAFDVVVAGDDASRPKPFPDPYLQACAALQVDPAEAVAIEDSPNGVRSAVAAGAAVIAVPRLVSVAGAGAHGVWPGLAGRSVADLVAFHAEHAAHAEAVRR